MSELDDLIARFAEIGATVDGGVCRLTGTAQDKAARDLFLCEIGNRGLVPRIDAIGNMFGVAVVAPASRDVVLTGSHLDSQPTGGRYDGAYGVLAGLLAVEAVRERCLINPGVARRNLAVVNWTNEEGARFQPSLTGSSVFAGSLSLQDARACRDADNVTLGDALSTIGYCGTAPLEQDPVRYVELHVEQGDRLERAAADIAAVSAAWMTRKISVMFEGDYSHTGPMPMALRRDALRAAARAIEALYEEVAREDMDVHASAARISVYPNSPNVVAGRARVWFEIRHEDEAVVTAVSNRFLDRIERESDQIGIGISIASDEKRSGTVLDPEGVKLALSAAGDLGFAAMTIKTITGHDALAVQRRTPASLIFVPSQGGLSHNPREFTAPEALGKGCSVLTEVLWRMVVAEE